MYPAGVLIQISLCSRAATYRTGFSKTCANPPFGDAGH